MMWQGQGHKHRSPCPRIDSDMPRLIPLLPPHSVPEHDGSQDHEEPPRGKGEPQHGTHEEDGEATNVPGNSLSNSHRKYYIKDTWTLQVSIFPREKPS